MGKNKGLDVIAEANEQASHNINPYYWFNRVTVRQMAIWRINRMLSPIYFALYSLICYLIFNTIGQLAAKQGKTFFSFLFDFSDSSTSARFVWVLLFSFYWIIYGIGTIQNILRNILSSQVSASGLEVKREKKKKQPKRPKNYK